MSMNENRNAVYTGAKVIREVEFGNRDRELGEVLSLTEIEYGVIQATVRWDGYISKLDSNLLLVVR